MMLGRIVFAVCCLVGLSGQVAADPDTLWRLVHDRCEPGLSHGDPSPCVFVQPGPAGYAVLKDLKGVAQYLLIPTERITGIEDPALLTHQGADLFTAAWDSRRFVEAKLGRMLPRDMVSLGVNSVAARSQEQLHIHVDCTKEEVRELLRQHEASVGPQWAMFPVPLVGKDYEAMRVDGAELSGTNPFALLKERVGTAAPLGDHDIVVVGSDVRGRPGFVLLERAGPAAHGTELQDLSCRGATTDSGSEVQGSGGARSD